MYNLNPIEPFVKQSVGKALSMRPDLTAEIYAARDIVLAGRVTIRWSGLEYGGMSADVWEDDDHFRVWMKPANNKNDPMYACDCRSFRSEEFRHKRQPVCRHTLAVALFRKAGRKQKEASERHPAYDLADKGAASQPELLDRMQKAADLVAAGKVKIHSANEYGVIGTVGNGYSITADACTCKDFTYRGGWCKHRLAVRMALALDQLPEAVPFGSDIPVEVRARREQYRLAAKVNGDREVNRQSWDRYCDSSYGKRRYIIKSVANGAQAIAPEVWEQANGFMTQEVEL